MAQAHWVSATATETLQLHEASTSDSPSPPQVQTVTLRLVPRIKKKVSWREDTVDNEHMEKKKSKICCIFHKDDDCDSDDGNDGDGEGEGEGKGKGKEQDHHHECNHAKHWMVPIPTLRRQLSKLSQSSLAIHFFTLGSIVGGEASKVGCGIGEGSEKGVPTLTMALTMAPKTLMALITSTLSTVQRRAPSSDCRITSWSFGALALEV